MCTLVVPSFLHSQLVLAVPAAVIPLDHFHIFVCAHASRDARCGNVGLPLVAALRRASDNLQAERDSALLAAAKNTDTKAAAPRSDKSIHVWASRFAVAMHSLAF